MTNYSSLVLIALMVVAFYFLMMRPARKRQQAQQQIMNALTPGTRVLLTSGVFGTLVELGDKQAVLEVSPGVRLTVLKQAIARPTRPGEEDETDDEQLEEPADLAGQPGGATAVDGPDTSSRPFGGWTSADATTTGDPSRPADGELPTYDRSGTNRTSAQD